METFTLIDAAGYTTKFTVKAAGNVCIEEFDQNGNSLGWQRVTTLEGGRSQYRKCIKDFGMKPVRA